METNYSGAVRRNNPEENDASNVNNIFLSAWNFIAGGAQKIFGNSAQREREEKEQAMAQFCRACSLSFWCTDGQSRIVFQILQEIHSGKAGKEVLPNLKTACQAAFSVKMHGLTGTTMYDLLEQCVKNDFRCERSNCEERIELLNDICLCHLILKPEGGMFCHCRHQSRKCCEPIMRKK